MYALIYRSFGSLLSLLLVFFITLKYPESVANNFFMMLSAVVFFSSLVKWGSEDYIFKSYSKGVSKHSLDIFILKVSYHSIFIAIFSLVIMHLFGLKYFSYLQYYAFIIALPMFVYSSLKAAQFHAESKLYLSSTISTYIMPLIIIVTTYIFTISTLPNLILVFLVSYFSQVLLSIKFSRKIGGESRKKKYLLKDSGVYDRRYLAYNNILGIASIHLIILFSGYFLDPKKFADFVIILKTCQAALIMVVLLNFKFIPSFSTYIRNSNYSSANKLVKTYIAYGIIISVLLSIVLLMSSSLLKDYMNLRILSIVDQFYLLWPGYAVNLAFGSIGYTFILLSQEKISFMIGLVSLVGQLLVIFIFSNDFNVLLLMLAFMAAFPKFYLLFVYFKKKSIFFSKFT